MRPHEVAASVETTQWETILAAVREHHPEKWHDLERTACQDQRIPPRLWQRYSPGDHRALVRAALGAPASGPLALDVLREYLLHDQRALVIRFLDLAGVGHEEGVLSKVPCPDPEAATLDAAVDTLLAEEPRAMALLYLRALAAQDNVEWPRLQARLAAESQAPAAGCATARQHTPRVGGGHVAGGRLPAATSGAGQRHRRPPPIPIRARARQPTPVPPTPRPLTSPATRHCSPGGAARTRRPARRSQPARRRPPARPHGAARRRPPAPRATPLSPTPRREAAYPARAAASGDPAVAGRGTARQAEQPGATLPEDEPGAARPS